MTRAPGTLAGPPPPPTFFLPWSPLLLAYCRSSSCKTSLSPFDFDLSVVLLLLAAFSGKPCCSGCGERGTSSFDWIPESSSDSSSSSCEEIGF